MADTRFMYGATETTTETLLSQSVPGPKSIAQAAAPFVAEFIGTFALVFTVGCCVLSPGDPSWNTTAVGLALVVMVYATTPVSMGNLNPAVSLCLCLVGKLTWPVMLGYWVVQVAGGIAAGFCVCALFTPRKAYIQPGPSFTWEYPVAAEFIYTCMLCFVVLNCTIARRNCLPEDANQFYGLAVGLVVVAGGYAASGISGACFNPAVAVGFDVSSSPAGATGWSLGWTVAELCGALVAAILFRNVRPEDFVVEEEFFWRYYQSMVSKCLSEFCGTFMIVLTVGLNVIMGSSAVPWSAAGAVVSMTYSLGNASGAHFNPAVTLAVALCSKCSLREVAAYMATQLAAGIAAGFAVGSFHAASPLQDTTYDLGPGIGYSLAAAGILELFFTSVLAYVVLACSTVATPPNWRTRQNNYFGLAVGCCVATGGFAAGPVSGGELNPAVCFGIATSSLYHHNPQVAPRSPLSNCFAFSMWECAGGLLAAAVFRKTHPNEVRGTALLAK